MPASDAALDDDRTEISAVSDFVHMGVIEAPAGVHPIGAAIQPNPPPQIVGAPKSGRVQRARAPSPVTGPPRSGVASGTAARPREVERPEDPTAFNVPVDLDPVALRAFEHSLDEEGAPLATMSVVAHRVSHTVAGLGALAAVPAKCQSAPAEAPQRHRAHTQAHLAMPLAQPLPRPLRIGRYELTFRLACSELAEVFLARVAGPGGFEKFVALKKIHPELSARRDFVKMFLTEARIAAAINHPHVCPVFDFGCVDGAYYLAMDFILGESLASLARVLRSGASKRNDSGFYPRIARIVADLAEGLHAAHTAQGSDGEPLRVVHRDVAPPNLFVRYDGHVQLVDFGIAAVAGQVQTGLAMGRGNPGYMAPEQFRRGAPIDARTDVWSLGVVLWEALTGRRLFKQDDSERTREAVQSGDIPSPQQFEPTIPNELAAVAQAALRRDPDARYPSALAMSRQLHHYILRSGTLAGPPEVSQWMHALFPLGYKQRLELMHQARARLAVDKAVAWVPEAAGQPLPWWRRLWRRSS